MRFRLSGFLQMPPNLFIFERLHPVIGYYYLQFFGWLYYRIRVRERRLIEANIRDMLGPGVDPRVVRAKIRESFRGIFMHYFEKLFAAFRPLAQVSSFVSRHFQTQGIEIVDRALARGQGAIIATAHFGAVEFVPWVFAVRGLPIDVIMECATDRLRRAIEDKATHFDVRLYSTEEPGGVFARALHSLAENRLLMTECDEVDTWHKRKNRRIELFGRELYFDNTLDILSRRSGAPVIAVFLKRTGFLRYTMEFEDVSLERETHSVARDTLCIWEKHVTAAPEQWYQWKKWSDMKVAS